MSFLELFGPTAEIIKFIFRFWWIWFGPLSFVIFVALWLAWRQQLYKSAVSWVLLELKFPREILKTPKAMDQFFSALHGVRNAPGDPVEKYWDGEVSLWFSFEIVTLGGDIHFFIRTPTKHRNVLEANMYANYPTVEIEEVKDYMERFPKTLDGLYARGLNLWGSELVLVKADAYPIRTYVQFQEIDEERSLDPIASVMEVFKKIDRKENILFQMLVRPVHPDRKAEGDKLVEELKKKDVKIRQSPYGEYEDKPIRTPGETEVLKTIEENLSRSAYDTLIRYIYIADKSVYNISFAKRGTISACNQYAAQNMNYFSHNYKVYTQVRWINWPFLFARKRAEARKERLLQHYRMRRMPEETLISKYLFARAFNFNVHHRTFVMSTAELATLYHPPSSLVLTAPLIRRVESKRMGPPVSAEIFGEEQ